MTGQPIVYETLERMNIPYEVIQHPPMFTIEDMERMDIPPDAVIAKNLFLRDAKGRRHYLVVVHKDNNPDLRGMGKQWGTRLSFGSDARLEKYLGLTKGSVSPFGVLNDAGCEVEVYFDNALKTCARVGVHPNLNTASLLMAFPDIVRVVREHGNKVEFFDA